MSTTGSIEYIATITDRIQNKYIFIYNRYPFKRLVFSTIRLYGGPTILHVVSDYQDSTVCVCVCVVRYPFPTLTTTICRWNIKISSYRQTGFRCYLKTEKKITLNQCFRKSAFMFYRVSFRATAENVVVVESILRRIQFLIHSSTDEMI